MQTRLLTSAFFLIGGFALSTVSGCGPESAKLSDHDGMQSSDGEDGNRSDSPGDAVGDEDAGNASEDASPPVDGAGGAGGAFGEPDDSQRPGEEKPALPAPLASGIRLDKLVVYQGVAIPLMSGGQAVQQRKAPIVEGRDAMLRVHVAPSAGFTARELAAEVSFEGANAPQLQRQVKTVRAASSEADLGSTFNFDIPGAQMTPDLAVYVAIRETEAGGPEGSSEAEWPQNGKMRLGPQSSNGNLKLVIVPIRYQGDNSGRLPDTSAAHIAKLRDRFNATYPTPDTEVVVREPIGFGEQFSRSGTGWSRLLNQTCAVRQQDKADRNVYYYGLIAPSSSFSSYCGGSCVTGLANVVSNPSDDYGRCSIGIGFGDDRSIETALHEIGHTHGRNHAPCGNPSGVDRSYPYSGASTGVWGYDLTHKQLRDPSKHKDFLAYCSPIWISDYTYNALFERLSYVNGKMSFHTEATTPTTFRVALIEGDGQVEWGETLELPSAPTGDEHELSVFDEDGKSAGSLKGYFYSYSHLPGGTMLVPVPSSKAIRAVELPGHRGSRVLRF